MTKAKHTQGPWEVGADQDGMLVKDSDGDTICSIYHWQGVYKAQANAHLIAAAPLLLNELEKMVWSAVERLQDIYVANDYKERGLIALTEYAKHYETQWPQELLDAAAAIAKAEGAD